MTETEEIRIVAEPGSLVDKICTEKGEIKGDLGRRLHLLEEYDFGFLLLGLSPRRLLSDGRLFDNEQVLPLLLHFSRSDKYCRYWASEIMRNWLIFNRENEDIEHAEDESAVEFRNYFFKKYAIPLIEEFRKFVALCMVYPDKQNAPPGPVDMVWHSFILNTEAYAKFSQEVWYGAPHMPPDILEIDC